MITERALKTVLPAPAVTGPAVDDPVLEAVTLPFAVMVEVSVASLVVVVVVGVVVSMGVVASVDVVAIVGVVVEEVVVVGSSLIRLELSSNLTVQNPGEVRPQRCQNSELSQAVE